MAGAGSGRPVPEPGQPVRYKADSQALQQQHHQGDAHHRGGQRGQILNHLQKKTEPGNRSLTKNIKWFQI